MKGILFTGFYEVILDSKNRLYIPAEYRKSLKESNIDELVLVSFPSYSKLFKKPVISCYTTKEYKKIIQCKGNAENIDMYLRGMAKSIDSLGRIVIPQILSDNIISEKGDRIAIAGRGSYFNIWNSADYGKYIKKLSEIK